MLSGVISSLMAHSQPTYIAYPLQYYSRPQACCVRPPAPITRHTTTSCSRHPFSIDSILSKPSVTPPARVEEVRPCQHPAHNASFVYERFHPYGHIMSHPAFYHPVFGKLTDRDSKDDQHIWMENRKSKRVRTIFTPEQLERLEKEFDRQQYMVGTERHYLASDLGLTETQVKVWFQNRRIKWRRQNLENHKSASPEPEKSTEQCEEDSPLDPSSPASQEEIDL